ncbi:hypothetical protein Ahy_A05g023095 [Arachis hypogaea]|uniref:Uncharacterized protein n=1 Tax=Arachis hypogaea TaxID=3818 RepID=A0A445D2H1_ARAHY|nr:hypothetical protein Ahy_A05g023095 [Arachis hypogaea]
MIRKIFDHRMVMWLQQMMQYVHERRDHLIIWLCPDIKKVLYVHWETDEGFRNHLLTNRANRISGRSSNYTGGSATSIKTMAMLSKSLDRGGKNLQRLEAATQQSLRTEEDGNNSADSVVDLDMVRCETASELYKNRVYWLAQQLQQSKETYNEILARMSDTDSIRLELRQELERIQWMQQQMAMYHEQMLAGGSSAVGGTPTSQPSPPPQQNHGMTTTTTIRIHSDYEFDY